MDDRSMGPRSRDGPNMDDTTSTPAEMPLEELRLKRWVMGRFILLQMRLSLLFYTVIAVATSFNIVSFGLPLSVLMSFDMGIIFTPELPHRIVFDAASPLRSLHLKLLLPTHTTILAIGALSLPHAFSKIPDILVVGLLHILLLVFYCVILFRRELLLWLHIKIHAWHARACVGVFNWKNACAKFMKKLSMRTMNCSNDELKHFMWTCVSPHNLGRIKSRLQRLTETIALWAYL